MYKIRKSNERGHVKQGWLESFHTFSFAEYYDPEHMHFSYLRVINEDFVASSNGFGMHPHNDMEIMTYMIDGELQHKDSMGNTSVIKKNEVQFMRAGTGVLHSEVNPSQTTTAHLLQIWVIPKDKGLKPAYAQSYYDKDAKLNKFCVLASPDGREGSFAINQDVVISSTIIDSSSPKLKLDNIKNTWIQVVSGELIINSLALNQGDALAVTSEEFVEFSTNSNAEFIVFHFI